ncbi:HAMP domain-containing sensor histidine kinase [soil metagenome]
MNVRSYLLVVVSIVLLAGGLFVRSRYSREFHPLLVSTIQKNIASELDVADQEAKRIIADDLSPDSPAWDEADHFFVHTDSNRMITWNQTDYLPDLSAITNNDTLVFIQLGRGDFLIRRWVVEDRSSLYVVIKLIDRYPIINNFLSTQWNPSIFPVRELEVFNPLVSAGEPILINGKLIFKIAVSKVEAHENLLSLLLLLTGIAFLIVWLWKCRAHLERHFSVDASFALVVTGLLLVRLIMIYFSIPSLYFSSDIFDPKQFASSSLNASLGDLFFNAIALLLIITYLFANFDRFKIVQWTLQRSGTQRFLVGVICLTLCFFGLLFPYDFVESIYHNSTLSLDLIQSLSFDKIRIIAVTSVLIGCMCSFLFIHVLFSLANHLFDRRNTLFFIALLVAALIFLLQFYILERNLSITLILGVIYFSILKISKLNRGVFRISFQLFIYLLFSLAIFSFQNAWAVRLFNTERQIQDQFRFGKDFLTERDVLGEYLLDQARQRIEKDPFIQMRMASPFLSKSAVEDKVRRLYLNNYFDRYEIAIRTEYGEQFNEDMFTNLDSILDRSAVDYLATGYTGISYARTSEGNTVKRYRVAIPVFYLRPVGKIVLDLSLKRVIPDNVYPELLVDNRFNQIYRNRDFSYAIFSKGKVASSFGPFNYERDFQIAKINSPELFSKGIADGDYFHIGIEDADGSMAIVSAASYPTFYFITNFSFWFGLGLLLLFAGQLIVGSASFLSGQQVNYTTRIQLFIFLAFLLPVLAVSITTFSLIGKSNEESIQKDFLDRSEAISHRIADIISPDSSSTVNTLKLERWIGENATSSKVDISVYSPEGKLIATSQPALFDNQLISPLLDRQAFKEILVKREVQTVTNERIGKLQYSCAYTAVLSPESGKLKAIVGLPFFESATFLQKSQSLIVSNILIVFVLVFILFSLLSFWASRSLTFPIRFITKTLGQTTLTGQNKQLQWNSSDEIGTLVKEYNRMVDNLEESKRALAQSEKESAWREMAKQVAHEIKNPLTPMKLTLQQMEQALRLGSIPQEKSQKSVDVLLKQVEILNEIATSFSTFANMPAPSSKKVHVNEFLQSAVNLFSAETNARVVFSMTGNAMIFADPTSLSRAISNIIINALQAKKDNQDIVDINIDTLFSGEKITLIIRDNGKGMSEEVQEKIFQPQFTTKQTGSGLGLAMTRQIIGQANGKIWFESTLNQGTTFFIELPISE